MLPAVQLDGEHRAFLPAVLLVHHKVEPPCVEQVQPGLVLHENLRDGNLLAHHAPAAIQLGVVQRVVEIFQKGRLGFGAVWLDAQRAGGGRFFCHNAGAVGAGVLHQLVQVVAAARGGVQAVQLLLAGHNDQLFPRPRYRHIQQLLVVLQPVVGGLPGAVGEGQRENDDVLLVPLKGVYRAAGIIGELVVPQCLPNQRPLPGKGGDDAHAALRVAAQIVQDGLYLLRGGVALAGGVFRYVQIHQRTVALHLAGDVQAVVVVFFVVEGHDFRMAAVVIAEQHLIAQRIAGQKALVDGILQVIVFLRHPVAAAQRLVVPAVQHHHRAELLGVAHQQQAAAPQNGHQRHRRVALAGLVHHHHVKQRLWLAQLVGGAAGGGDDGKDAQQLFQIFLFGKVLVELAHQLAGGQRRFQNFAQRLVALVPDAQDILGGGVVQITVQRGKIRVQTGEGILSGDGAQLVQLPFQRIPLAQQVGLEGHLAAGLQQPLHRLLALLQFQDLFVPLQQLRQPAGLHGALLAAAVQRGLKNLHVLALPVQRAHGLDGLFRHVVVAQPQNGKGNGLPAKGQALQLVHHAIDGMVVVGGEQHRLFVEKGGDQNVQNGAGLAGARRPLHIGQRIAQGVVHGKQLVQIHMVVQQRHGHRGAAAGTAGQLPEKGPQRNGDLIVLVQVQNAAVLLVQIGDAVPPDAHKIGHVIHPAQRGIFRGDEVLDALLILLKIVQQHKVVRVQKLADALDGGYVLACVQQEFPAQRHLLSGAQRAVFHIQIQRPVGQHIQPVFGGDAQQIQPQRHQPKRLAGAALSGGALLEPLHDLAELPVIQLVHAVLQAAFVQPLNELVVRPVGGVVQLAAGGQIVQHPQVGGAAEQRVIAAGVVVHIPQQCLVAGAKAALHHLGPLDAVKVQGVLLHRVIVQVQPIHDEGAVFRVQPPDARPEPGHLVGAVSVFDAQPLALVEGAEHCSGDTGHAARPPFVAFLIIAYKNAQKKMGREKPSAIS